MMGDSIKVSVIIPCRNGEGFIDRALDSVIAQTFEDWELCVVNDGSTDSTAEILEAYRSEVGEKLRVFSHEGTVSKGVGASRNLALRYARGELVAFLDADDEWYPQKLERQVSIFEQSKEVCLVFSRAQCIDELGHDISEAKKNYPFWGVMGNGPACGVINDPQLEFLRNRIQIICSSVMARKSMVLAADAFPELMNVQIEDTIMWFRLSLLGGFVFLPEVLLGYRMHPSSYSCKSTQYQLLMAQFQYYREVTARRADRESVIETRLGFLASDIIACTDVSIFRKMLSCLKICWFARKNYGISFCDNMKNATGRFLRTFWQ